MLTKSAEKKIDKRVEQIYYRRCSGIAINVMDIGKIFNVGRASALAGDDDTVLGDKLHAFVKTIAQN